MKVDLRTTLGEQAPLGQTSPYPKHYDKKLLYPVMRNKQREAMGFPADIQFFGCDIWNCYELSWLNEKGKPKRASFSFILQSSSTYLAESKSVKLYLNSLNHHRFGSEEQVRETIERDLSSLCETEVTVQLNPQSLKTIKNSVAPYYCLDELDVAIDIYERDPSLLKIDTQVTIEDQVVTHLYKSHCLCTGQPDWGSIFIDYKGPKIMRESLLKYLISYYDHVGFAENCIEQIYVDLMQGARFERLRVFGRFTRRGGIDINPYRQSERCEVINERLIYQ
ncbi:MAG TPA: NADPH-dependent 7-cyano-7-deazaguanine reductase QueF [Myxococcota bacterium]|nr:NADPH-dependent 7-cyano-7-deazaguanine reductase QueF [Myxococcota bacterium]